MPETKDVKKKEEEKKEEKIKKEKEPSWLAKVPILYKLLAVILLFIQWQRISAAGGSIQEMWMWFIAIIIALYVIGAGGLRRETDILSPEDAEKALKKEIARKVREGQIDRWARIIIGPNNGLFHQEGLPRYYQIGIEIIGNPLKEYKRGIVFAEGNTKGFVTIQDSVGKLTGREVVPVRTPRFFKDIRKYGIDWDKLVFGGKEL